MPHYLIQGSYTSEAWAAMLKKPQDRSKAIQKTVKELGGRVEGFWLAFGESDIVGIIQMPDNVSMAAFAISVAAGGACSSVKTTPLLSLEEAKATVEKAAAGSYRPPSA